MNNDPMVITQLDRAEKIDPRHIRLHYINCQSPQFVPYKDLQVVENVMHLSPLERMRPLMLITRESRLYKFVTSKYQIMTARMGLEDGHFHDSAGECGR